MRHCIVGMGSMGKRHIRNLRLLRPDPDLDPIITIDAYAPANYSTLNADVIKDSVVYICTPTNTHWDTYHVCLMTGAKAIFCEKPLMQAGSGDVITAPTIPFACGYQYRFHPVFRDLREIFENDLPVAFHIYANESLSDRYTDSALELLLAHPIATTQWIFGDMQEHTTLSKNNGFEASHFGETVSGVDISMVASMLSNKRISLCIVDYKDGSQDTYNIYPDDNMYLRQMEQFLEYVTTGNSGDLCTFEQAMKVQELLR